MTVSLYKDDVLLSTPEIAKTQWEKIRGLMFRKQHDVLFHWPQEQRLKFHMVFVFYPIDIVFMDKDLKVVDLKKRFRPFTCYYSKAKSSTVLETYHGFIDDHGIKLGDTLRIEHQGELDWTPRTREREHTSESRSLHGTSLGRHRPAVARTVSSDEHERHVASVAAEAAVKETVRQEKRERTRKHHEHVKEEAVKAAAKAGELVASETSSTYHKPSCRYAKSIKRAERITFSSKKQASAKGYSACKVCKP